MASVDSSLASQCMDFCQALASQNKSFTFSLTIGSTFAFSLDTKESCFPPAAKAVKRKSPSAIRRNARRRAEFLKKKKSEPLSCTADFIDVTLASRDDTVKKVFKCDQCENNFKSENGLKIHIGKTHKKVDSDFATPECPRQQPRSSVSLSASPLLNICREESTINPDVVVGDLSPTKSVRKHTCPSYLCSSYQCPKETEEQKRHYQKMQELLEKGSF